MISDKKEALVAVKQDGFALEYLSDELRADKEVVLTAVKQDRFSLQFASAELKVDQEVLAVAEKKDFSEFPDATISDKKEDKPEYKIIGNIDGIGYCREGDGRVLYVFNGESDYSATDAVIERAYTDEYEGEIDHAEYDPSFINTDKYELQDEQSLDEVLEEGSANEKNAFFQDMLDNSVVVIFIDIHKKTAQLIRDMSEDGIKELIDSHQNLVLFAREYDHIYDY